MFFQNYITIEGRLTRKPELQTSKNGKDYCRFSICYNQQKKNKETDEYESIPHFFNCVAFNYNAKTVANMNKGDPVNVSGKLQFSQWEDSQGGRNTSVTILAENLKKLVIEKHNKADKATPEPNTRAAEPLTDLEKYEDEIPF